MPRTLICTLAIVIAAAAGAPAFAAPTGGASVPGKARVTAVACIPTAAMPCGSPQELVRGGRVRVTGRSLDASRTLVFRGARGDRDDVTAAARHVRAGHFEAAVPAGARSGIVEVRSAMGTTVRAPRSVRVTAPAPVDLAGANGTYFVGGQRQPTLTVSLGAPATISVEAVREPGGLVVARWDVAAPAGTSVVRWDAMTVHGPALAGVYRLRTATVGGVRAASSADSGTFALADHIFPIRGPHDLGQSATNDFGGARRHQGQDMFAACGTRLAAARAGTVKFAATDARAGNYVVIAGAGSGLDYVYMHMRAPATVAKGQQVFTGQKIGDVGDSGNADGCHLHFELWRAPGWYTGGSAIDPLGLLRAWDAVS